MKTLSSWSVCWSDPKAGDHGLCHQGRTRTWPGPDDVNVFHSRPMVV